MSKSNKKYMPWGVTLVVALIIIWSVAALFWMFFYVELTPVFYQKEGGVYLLYNENKTPRKLEGAMGNNIKASKNGRNIFFLDNAGILHKTKTKSGATKKLSDLGDIRNFYLTGNARKIILDTYYNHIYIIDINNFYRVEPLAESGYILTYHKKALYYLDDFDFNEKGAGTLKIYEKGKVREIDSNVTQFEIFGENKYYVKEGRLYWLNGNKTKLIDSTVERFIKESL